MKILYTLPSGTTIAFDEKTGKTVIYFASCLDKVYVVADGK